ncbi:helix-turn-helix transcriptional regulator [Flammeovirga kamogawensis]|uniref:AraC family transcriptional regulator n=1 Tax=Flammeovirga kamogawensis TaxID=373891 RepID=A0ABX8GQD3_9BACT|nr:helix-turn-helix domain-containing protein [Flammeovirga kamogawensis]MBB6463036.1 AraC-like DNA-binding protein [Flammeovirga kamogawensis]QWG05673.1 AraC family transcriptional regulator [Flammeovirga kamogawensis]
MDTTTSNIISFQTGSVDYVLEQLKTELNGTIENNILTVHHPFLELSYEKIDTFEGLGILLHDVYFKQNVDINIEGNNEAAKYIYYRFEYKGNIVFDVNDPTQYKLQNAVNCMSMFSTQRAVVIKGMKGERSRWLSVRISKDFLENNATIIYNNFFKIFDIEQRWAYFEIAPVEVILMLEKIFTLKKDTSIALKKSIILGKTIEMVGVFVDRMLKREDNSFNKSLHENDLKLMFNLKEELTQLFDKTPLLPELAKKYGISESKLKRDFKVVFGTTVPRFHQNFRLETAYTILSTEHKSIIEVARIVGFSSTSKFSSIFKKHYGVTPKEISVKYKN